MVALLNVMWDWGFHGQGMLSQCVWRRVLATAMRRYRCDSEISWLLLCGLWRRASALFTLIGPTVAVFLFGGDVAHAQTPKVLVSKLRQPFQTIAAVLADGTAQGFRTGTNAAGYTLTSIELLLGGTSTDNFTVTLQSGSAAGSKVAEFTATSIGTETESASPDLIGLGPNVSNSNPETGGSFWFIVTVTNQGDGRSAATTVRYYRSTDATITTSDTEIGTDAVRALDRPQGYAATIKLTAPSNAGTYYYGACVDAVSGESDTGNNCSSGVRVTVSAPPPPPPPPVAPTVTEVSTTSMTVGWTAPGGGGPVVRNYDVRYRIGSEGEWGEGPQDVTGTSAIIEGLEPDTAYEVQVRSSGSSGDSEWVALSTVRTAAPPLPPVDPGVTERSSSSLTVGWTAPTAEGPPITGYDVRYRVGSDGAWTDGPQDMAGTSAIIEGLEPDTAYEVQVRSSSAAGNGEWAPLVMARTEVLILYDLFSVSLDLDSSAGHQYVWLLHDSPGGVVPIQVFGADIRNTRSLSVRVGYDSTQVAYAGFDVADVLPIAHALVKQDSTVVEIGIASLGGRAVVDSGLVGTLRFRTTDAFSETEVRLAGVELTRGEHPEAMTRSVSIVLQAAAPSSPDFDGTGTVAFADFVLFAGAFGSDEGDVKYVERYDLNGDGGIGFEDFVIFAKSFGKTVNRAPVFALAPPVTRSVAENAPAGEPIGDPVVAADEDGDTLMYIIWGADAEHFDVDPSTGQLLTKGTYDFEKKKGYAVIVRVRDGQGGRVNVVVNIAVTDVAE